MNIECEIMQARRGLIIWKSIKEKYQLSDCDCVVCFPTSNEQLNNVASSHVDRYAKAKYYKRAILLMEEGVEISMRETREDVDIVKEYLDDQSMKSLVYFFRLMSVGNNVTVVSAEEPFGNLNLIGKYGIDMEEYVSGTYI